MSTETTPRPNATRPKLRKGVLQKLNDEQRDRYNAAKLGLRRHGSAVKHLEALVAKYGQAPEVLDAQARHDAAGKTAETAWDFLIFELNTAYPA